MEEQWKDIQGWEDYYQISNLGCVRGKDRYVDWMNTKRFIKGEPLVPVLNTDGYYGVKLTRNNCATSYKIHRLVAEAFLDNPLSLPEVNHIDCNRTNNCLNNLEWITHNDNVAHSASKGKYKHYGKDNGNYGKHTLKYIYSMNPELAKEKLSRPRSRNGRAKTLILLDINHDEIFRFDWIGGCAEYLKDNYYTNATIDSIRSRITMSIKTGEPAYQHYYKFA